MSAFTARRKLRTMQLAATAAKKAASLKNTATSIRSPTLEIIGGEKYAYIKGNADFNVLAYCLADFIN